MASQVELARAFYRRAAHMIDLGADATRLAAMAKLFASEMAERVFTSRGSPVHGGNGYTTRIHVERHWRDARLTKIFEGTSDIQRRSSPTGCGRRS